jgi:Hemolysins and related proteins containing CBS domains
VTGTWAILLSVALLVLNGFFVAAEFALVASKRHRLEQAAAAGSRAAAAALAGSRELSLMLAGAQLGITLCSLGLGALAKPAVADLLEPLLEATGLPDDAAYVVAFLLALSVVVFLHMVVGEMAPKSWAISHPESSALLLALPFRAFARVSRPALAVLNGLANTCLRAVRVTPQNELAQVHGPEELRILLEESREHGLLPAHDHQLLTAALALQNRTIETVMVPATGSSP